MKADVNSIAAIYDYVDENNGLLFQILRYTPKCFRERRPEKNAGWVWNLQGVRLVLYRLPQVMQAGTVLILEGEKDVETAYRLGLPPGVAATTSPLGAGQWRSEFSEFLRGKRVCICPDNDLPGQQHLKQIVRDLAGKAAEIRKITLPGIFKDLSAWEENGATPEQFAAMLLKAELVD